MSNSRRKTRKRKKLDNPMQLNTEAKLNNQPFQNVPTAITRPVALSNLPKTSSSAANLTIRELLNKRKNLRKNIDELNKAFTPTVTVPVQRNFEKQIADLELELSSILKQLNLTNSHEWILDIVNEAKVPYLGLPVEWDKTQKEHSLIIFDPSTKKTINLKTNEEKTHSTTPLKFFSSTTGVNPMPGSNAPASVRYTRYNELVKKHEIVKDARGNEFSLCPTHGGFVKIEALQSDHMQPKENILKKQSELINLLNENKELSKVVLACDGIDKFFVKYNNKLYGTLLFYEVFYNDIENIWLICQSCNLHKTNADTLQYLKKQWLYGEEFADYIVTLQLKNAGILLRTDANKGLAEIAISWFWKRHASYITTEKNIFGHIIKPLQSLNQKTDRLEGATNTLRAERNKSTTDLAVGITMQAANERVKFSRESDEESGSSLNTSVDDEAIRFINDDGTKITFTKEERDRFNQLALEKYRPNFKNFLTNIAKQIKPEETIKEKIKPDEITIKHRK